jgi:hypothetical protein
MLHQKTILLFTFKRRSQGVSTNYRKNDKYSCEQFSLRYVTLVSGLMWYFKLCFCLIKTNLWVHVVMVVIKIHSSPLIRTLYDITNVNCVEFML